ncbi:MAG: hypothetical protein IH608_07085, partial [Proteobacteria bacterium]|nr:hypothetical protein [Pseudomonadota bacterium]
MESVAKRIEKKGRGGWAAFHQPFSAPDRVSQTVPHRHPGETAFVLGRAGVGGPWRYLGVGRWDEKEGAWAIPEVDFVTRRALGRGRSALRRLEPRWNEKARELVGQVLAV